MSAPIDTDAPRFRVLTTAGYPIWAEGRTAGNTALILVAVVYDGFHLRDIATFRSSDSRPAARSRLTGAMRSPVCECGGRKALAAHQCCDCARRAGAFRTNYGFEGALVAAAERCAELNAWHEREGWGEDVPLAS